MVQEKYAVRLSSEDQEQLRGLIHGGRHSASGHQSGAHPAQD